jgi:hypothetical protein
LPPQHHLARHLLELRLPKSAQCVSRSSRQINNNDVSLGAFPVAALQASEYGIMDRHIVPIQPASGRGELVVIEVLQQGAHELDLRLVGCEGANPYVVQSKGDPNVHRDCYAYMGAVKQSELPKLKQKFKGTNAEWEAVLAHFLQQKQLGPDQANLLEGVRMVYTLKKDGLEVSIRQDVQGIKVRQHQLGRV